MKFCKYLILLVFYVFLVNFSYADEFSSLLNQRREHISFFLYDIESNRVISSYKDNRPLKPASLLKILTSFAALRTLGAEYTFNTKVYVEGQKGGYVDRLIIEGGGDPSLDIEELWKLAREIKKSGIQKIGTVVLDDTLYMNINKRGGQRAYEARATALALNYNSMEFKVCPTNLGKPASVTNEPFEYYVNYNGNIITDSKKHFYTIDEAKEDKLVSLSNLYNLSGNIKYNAPCDTFYRSVSDPLLYFTQVFYDFLNYLGIQTSKKFVASVKHNNAKLLFTHTSMPLKQILEGLNHYSVNVTADHLVYAVGNTQMGKNFDVGLDVLNNFVRDFGCLNGCNIVDGSGLSHENLVNARTLGNILVSISKNPSISIEFENSLPTLGKSGTLKNAHYLPSAVVLRAKTGTINGVRGLAGYIYSQRGRKYAFVIMQNNVTYPNAISLEKKLVNLINNRINRK